MNYVTDSIQSTIRLFVWYWNIAFLEKSLIIVSFQSERTSHLVFNTHFVAAWTQQNSACHQADKPSLVWGNYLPGNKKNCRCLSSSRQLEV